jgi:hypothetical protein
VTALDFNIQCYLAGRQGQHVFESREPFATESRAKPRPGIQASEFTPGEVTHPSTTVSRAIYSGIVEHHESAITATLHITFEHIRAQLNRASKGRQRILGTFA